MNLFTTAEALRELSEGSSTEQSLAGSGAEEASSSLPVLNEPFPKRKSRFEQALLRAFSPRR